MFDEPYSKKRRLEHAPLNTFDSNSSELQQNQDTFFYVYEAKKRSLKPNLKLGRLTAVCLKKNRGLKINENDDKRVAYALRPLGNNRINLFDMCMRFVALNFDLVECLNGLPCLIGEMLFIECVRCQKFNAKKEFQNATQYLNVFARAYSDLLIESLNLSNKKLVLENLWPTLSRSSFIKQLDLSNCNLSSLETSLYECLKASSTCLQYLNLSQNSLDESFVQKFTLPQRLNIVNFEKLSVLDLRNNSKLKLIDSQLLKYFVKYESLNELLIDSSPKESSTIMKQLQRTGAHGFHLCFCDKNSIEFRAENLGWINRVYLDDLVTVEREKIDSQRSSSEDYKNLIKQINEGSCDSTSLFKSELKFYKKVSTNKKENESANGEEHLKIEKRYNLSCFVLKRKCDCFEQNVSTRANESIDRKTTKKSRTISAYNSLNKNNLIVDKDDLLKIYL